MGIYDVAPMGLIFLPPILVALFALLLILGGILIALIVKNKRKK